MKQSTIFALSAALLASTASAKPMVHKHLHNKRDMVTVTVVEDITETVDVFVTIYGPPPGNDQQASLNVHQDQAAHDKPAEQPAAKATPAIPVPPPVMHQNNEYAHANPSPQLPAPTLPPAPVTPIKNEQPAPQQPAPQQKQQPPPPQQQPQSPPSKQETPPSTAGSGPSGGACGQVGGKCMASDVTIYNDQGAGACGWTNDTNSEDYFALAARTYSFLLDVHSLTIF